MFTDVPVLMRAKFAGKCSHCGQRIEAGEPIVWKRGLFTLHDRCDAPYMRGTPVTLPLPSAPTRVAIEDAGVYVLPDGTICKVQANREKTKTYAKRWTEIRGERLVETDERKRGEYVYEGGLVQRVAAEGRKMTLDEAKAFIIRYGVCCRCGRTLKAAESVERGIGPVCMRYFAAGTTGADLLAQVAHAHTH